MIQSKDLNDECCFDWNGDREIRNDNGIGFRYLAIDEDRIHQAIDILRGEPGQEGCWEIQIDETRCGQCDLGRNDREHELDTRSLRVMEFRCQHEVIRREERLGRNAGVAGAWQIAVVDIGYGTLHRNESRNLCWIIRVRCSDSIAVDDIRCALRDFAFRNEKDRCECRDIHGKPIEGHLGRRSVVHAALHVALVDRVVLRVASKRKHHLLVSGDESLQEGNRELHVGSASFVRAAHEKRCESD